MLFLLSKIARCFLCFLALLMIFSGLSAQAQVKIAEKADFWKIPKKGANYFNLFPEEQWFKAAHQLGLQWVRLSYDKWQPQDRDFLIGNADHYHGLMQKDLVLLKRSLDWAQKYQIKVVLVPLSLPGARWVQNNNDQPDLRLWQDKKYWREAVLFWQDLARELAHHPAVYAYNIINEPTPERGTGLAEQGDPSRYLRWYKKYKDTPHDLPAFYQAVIQSIRQVDPHTPIMLDAGWYAQANAFSYWPKIQDPHILYAFHMYEPYAFTNYRNFKQHKYVYPGKIPLIEETAPEYWDKEKLKRYFEPFLSWVEQNKIPAQQIVAAEFGCYRRNTGCADYLADLIALFNQKKFHWAFYSFREDWEGYDYELGTGQPPAGYWQAIEQKNYAAIKRSEPPIFQVLKRELSQP
jgi:aryl-phospho-beta-D-glucosidase BglC (GH1 family)